MRRVLLLSLFLGGCSGYAWKPAAGPAEKAKPPDCAFKVTETPPPDGYWHELGTFSGGSADTVAELGEVRPRRGMPRRDGAARPRGKRRQVRARGGLRVAQS